MNHIFVVGLSIVVSAAALADELPADLARDVAANRYEISVNSNKQFVLEGAKPQPNAVFDSIDALIQAAKETRHPEIVQTPAGPVSLGWNDASIKDRSLYDIAPALREFADFVNDDDLDAPYSSLYIEQRLIPRSLVGTVMSYEDSGESSTGGAHPNSWRNARAIDVRTGSPTLLSEMFTEASILSALKADRYINSTQTEEEGGSPLSKKSRAKLKAAKTLVEAEEILDKEASKCALDYTSVKTASEWSEPAASSQAQFYVTGYDAKKDRAQVRVTVFSSIHACAAVVPGPLGLSLTPRTPEARSALKAAVAGTLGKIWK